jgi:hypothetical protein
MIDPMGLIHWDGGYNYTSGGPAKFGAGVAATGFTFVLKSKCVDGKKAIVRVAEALSRISPVVLARIRPD